MIFTASKKELLRLIGRALGAVDRKSPMPILSNVLMQASDGRVTISATDLYLAVTGSSNADVEHEGSFAAPARDLFDRVKAMQDGPVTIKLDDGKLEVRAKGNARRYKIHGLSGDNFPNLTDQKDMVQFDINALIFASLMRLTSYAVSTDETRPHLNALLIEWLDKQIRMVGTDGHRLAYADANVDCPKVATILIPLKAALEVKKMVDELVSSSVKGTTPMITMGIAGPNAFFTVGDVMLTVKMVDAQFPAYQQVIPSGLDKTIMIPRVQMIDSVRAVALASPDRTGGVKVQLSRGTMVISSESPEGGDGSDEIPVDYSGSDVSVGFNAKYLVDVLSIFDQDEVTMLLGENLDPVLFRPASESGGKAESVVMPMRL